MNLSRRQFLGGVAAAALTPVVSFTRNFHHTTDIKVGFISKYSNTGPATLNINGMGSMVINRVHGFLPGDFISIGGWGSGESTLVKIISTTGGEPMGIIDRMLERFLPKPLDVITPMPAHVSGLHINSHLLGLHMAETDRPGRGLIPSAPKTVVPPL